MIRFHFQMSLKESYTIYISEKMTTERKLGWWGSGGALVGLWWGYGGAIAPHLRGLWWGYRPPLGGAIAPHLVGLLPPTWLRTKWGANEVGGDSPPIAPPF
jgi:hypothetical protein